ncbi:MAG TPA: RagB/SusD family nutrient uptake outer membrane protein [Cyclobacteriaceae bacterium]|nr:RagB/SusD family nutrient uptake outer membrane protein [Cyclobacteriaceae bacterium]
MKNITKILLGFFLGPIMVFSCKSDLELEPISQISNASFWKTENDAVGALYGMYGRFRDQGQNLYYWGEMRSQTAGNGVAGNYQWELEMFSNTLTSSTALPTWQGLYTVIHDANLLLRFVPQISFSSEERKNSILAQAYAMRAFCYFVMVRTWGDAVLVDEPFLSFDPVAVQRERTPKAEVLAFIKNDLEQALALFPDNNYPEGRNIFSRPAANALKGEVYLWTGKKEGGGTADFTTALNALTEITGTEVALLDDYASVFDYDNKGNEEIIFAVKHAEFETGDLQPYAHMWMYPAYIPATIDEETQKILEGGNGNSVLEVEPHVQAAFSEEDQRKDASFRVIYAYPDGIKTYYASIVYKYHGTLIGGLRYWYNDRIIYRYGDVLLMIAEAKNALRQDPSPEMNQIRQRAYGNNFPGHEFVSSGQETNDEAILRERLLEMAFEGKYWWDLLRFDKAFELVPSLQNKVGQDHLELFPIVLSTLSVEPKVQQNPGY